MTPRHPISGLRKAAQAAKTPELRAAALGLLRGALDEGPSDEAEIRCWIGRLLREDGDDMAALAALEHGIGLDSAAPPAWAHAERATLLLRAGRAAEAVDAARLGIEAGRSSPALFGALGHAALAADLPTARAEPLLRRAILGNPADRPLVEAWFDRLREERSQDEATAWLEGLQDESPMLLRGLLMVLTSVQGRPAVRARFAGKLSALRAEAPYAQCARVWRAVIDGTAFDEADAAAVGRNAGQASELFFPFVHPEPRQIALFSGEAADKAALEAVGVRVEALRAFATAMMRVENPAWRARLDRAGIADETARAFMRNAEDEGALLDTIVETGTLRMMDPLTGAIVEPFDSFVFAGRTIYSFRGQELFLLVLGKHWGAPIGIHLPRHDLSIVLVDFHYELVGEHLANVLFRLLKRHALVKPSLPAETKPRADRRIALFVPATESFAHQFWNYYSGLWRLISAGLTDRLDTVLFSGTEFFGPLEDLFPELPAVARPVRSNTIDPYPFAPDGLVATVGGFFVPRALTQRVIDTMRARPRLSASLPEPADYRQAGHAPVVWFGLRLRDKAWVDQEQGIGAIIRILSRRHPNALFLLDGYSYPVGEDSISAQWTEVIAALGAMAQRIRAASGIPERVVDMVGNTMRESVLWAQATDVYLAPYGSTQHKVGWFSTAPGLVYAPPVFTPELAACSPACSACEYGPQPHFLFAEAASAGERRGTNRFREQFANVTLDAAELAERLDALIAERRDAQSASTSRTPRY